MRPKHRIRARGYGLLEIALGLAIAALLIAGAMMYFANASESRKTKESVEMVSAIRAAVEQVYGGMAPDEEIARVIAQSKLLPLKWTGRPDGSLHQLSGPFGAVHLTAHTGFYAVTLNNVSSAACTKLATSDLIASNVSDAPTMEINGGGSTYQTTERKPVIQEVIAACRAHTGGVSMTFRYR